MADVEKRVRAALVAPRFIIDDPVRLYVMSIHCGLVTGTDSYQRDTTAANLGEKVHSRA